MITNPTRTFRIKTNPRVINYSQVWDSNPSLEHAIIMDHWILYRNQGIIKERSENEFAEKIYVNLRGFSIKNNSTDRID